MSKPCGTLHPRSTKAPPCNEDAGHEGAHQSTKVYANGREGNWMWSRDLDGIVPRKRWRVRSEPAARGNEAE